MTFISVEIGLAIALGVAVAIFFFKNAFPSTSVLGQVPHTLAFRCVRARVSAIQWWTGDSTCVSHTVVDDRGQHLDSHKECATMRPH